MLAKNQHPLKITLIVYHLHEHKLQADSIVSEWPSTDAHQCHTPATLSTACLKEPGHMPFPDQQACNYIFCILPGFLKDLPRVELWSVVLQPGQKLHWPSSKFDSTSRQFLSRHLAYTFLGRLRIDISR